MAKKKAAAKAPRKKRGKYEKPLKINGTFDQVLDIALSKPPKKA